MLSIVASFSPVALAQAPTTLPASDPELRARDPLATRQQIVRDRMTQLEDRMFRLTEKLAKTEPEQARKLEAAMKRSQELLIRRNMDDAIGLLDEGKLTDAADRQTAVVKGLEGVLRILLEEGDNTKERQAEIDRLKTYRDQVQQMLDQERKLKAQADAAPRLGRMLAGIRAAIARLEGLIGRQEHAIEGTQAAARTSNPAEAPKLGETQKAIRQETEEVNKGLEDPEARPDVAPDKIDSPPNTAPPPGGRPPSADPAEGEARTPDANGAQARPPEGESGKPAGAEPGKPSQGQPGNANPSGKSAEGKQPEADRPEGKSTGEKSEAPKDEAAIEAGVHKAREDMNQAAGQMQSAENELGKQALPEALPMQKKAVESLRRALQELKRQEQETRKLLDQAEAARRQRELENKTRNLSDQMKGGRQQNGQQGGQQQGGQQQQNGQQQQGQQGSERPDQPAPGNQNVEQAGQHMEKAAEELEKDKPRDAGPEQQKAVEQLEQAQRELEQALDQLRREQQEEILRGLESRFRAMLAQQLIINEATIGLDKKGQAAWAHADELKLAGLAQDQASVADQAGQALHILKEEGTTVVFPRIVEQMREDMGGVAALLNGKKTGARTQRIQADISTTLKEMIESIKELRKKIQNGEAGGSAGQSKNPPLLPSSAELKLLRSCQTRVNRQTTDFHGEHADPTALDDDVRRELEQIAHRQQEVAEMARKMNERIAGQ